MRLRPPTYHARSRRRFVILIIVIAVVAVLGGALLAYLILVDEPKKRTNYDPPAPPKPVVPFADEPIEAWDDEPTPELPDRPRRPSGGKPRPQTLDDDAIRVGLSRLQSAFNECARKYGAVDGSLVRVGFSATAEGTVSGVFALPPHAKTPLGRCIVDAVARARLRRTELGRTDIRWSIVLHP